MKKLQVFRIVISILLSTASTEALDYAKTGCKDSCGGIEIPFPFGIGSNCSVNEWYAIDCNSSKPYLSAFHNLEVSSVSLQEQTVTVKVPTISGCPNPLKNNSLIPSVDLGESPFLFSKTHNIFVVEGCGDAAILDDQNHFTGCSTTCLNESISEENNYSGISCQTTIPHYLQSYTVDLSRLQRLDGGGHCGSAFLVDEIYDDQVYEDYRVKNNSFIPISLMWTLKHNEIPNCWEGKVRRLTLDLGNGSYVSSKKCYCGVGREGNPYLHNQCQEFQSCKMCRDSGRICQYDERDVNDIDSGWDFFCVYPSVYRTEDLSRSKSPIGVILGISISIGLLFLAKIIFELYKLINKIKTKRRREKFFKHNGGLLLKQREATDTSLVDKTILFTATELEKATNHFDDNRILGRGGQGTVYKGMLSDGRIVAVKKSKVVDESQLEQFINEVVILSQINHRNVVKLLGCCLETEVPILVSEFIPNGTLYELIQGHTNDFPLSLNLRLQIAVEVSAALSYLHSETSIPIYHRDVKTTNILMDEKYRAKVSDFGTSRLVSIDQTHFTTLVKGTFGYLDPEYFQTSQFTEKSDVYSFGVVLLELLTTEKPISFTRFGENRNLATHFMLAMEKGHVMSIFDAMVVKEGSRDELLAIADLASRCLDANGRNRPTMKEVAMALEATLLAAVSHRLLVKPPPAGDRHTPQLRRRPSILSYRTFVLDIERLKVSNKTRSLEIECVISFFSEDTQVLVLLLANDNERIDEYITKHQLGRSFTPQRAILTGYSGNYMLNLNNF
ncbi:unnamed protein product [Lactuca virosa]|uniref:Protein kinase domain-containing protein n=1 Tax=Lactuca virosa TaxID=75947 RepID=A0AAU9NFU7_9ASTR|nr:unnamed protein product [Lactuca virosa]